jgi:hypothetical protein
MTMDFLRRVRRLEDDISSSQVVYRVSVGKTRDEILEEWRMSGCPMLTLYSVTVNKQGAVEHAKEVFRR